MYAVSWSGGIGTARSFKFFLRPVSVQEGSGLNMYMEAGRSGAVETDAQTGQSSLIMAVGLLQVAGRFVCSAMPTSTYCGSGCY